MKIRTMLFAWVLAGAFSDPALASGADCANSFYKMIATELAAADRQQGHPKPDFDSLGEIKDIGMAQLEDKVSQWPEDATFSISVLDDHIAVAIFCPGMMKKWEWRP
ncbi:MAG: hypothetical protein PHH36_00860 [Sideroxydans sp.]|nr:hypothetical protein [Sideroxydans sp.]